MKIADSPKSDYRVIHFVSDNDFKAILVSVELMPKPKNTMLKNEQ
ncbi:MAG: hypothetical protein AB8G86_30685 [Saprospiraceae bacterium]